MDGKDFLTTSHFPPGFRFHPTDEELILCYLRKKITSSLPSIWDIVADIDIYKFNPWDLPGKALVFGDGEWFFFSPRERKYPRGLRPNRSAGSGYWKATGTDKPILGAGGTHCIGVKKALVFYKGRPPKGTKTDWVMNEYRVIDSPQKQNGSMRLDDWVLCRVRKKGILPAAGDDVTETCSLAESSPAISRKSEENAVMKGSSFSADQFWNDCPLLEYNVFDFHEGRGAAAEELDPDGRGGDYLEIPSTVFGALKRKMSDGLVDESVLQQADKRLQRSPDGLLSTATSISGIFIDKLRVEVVVGSHAAAESNMRLAKGTSRDIWGTKRSRLSPLKPTRSHGILLFEKDVIFGCQVIHHIW